MNPFVRPPSLSRHSGKLMRAQVRKKQAKDNRALGAGKLDILPSFARQREQNSIKTV